MTPTPKFDVAKTVWWPGATPFCPLFAVQKPFGLLGSLPATFGLVADSPASFCHATCSARVHESFCQFLCEFSLTSSPQGFPFRLEGRDAFAQTT